MESKNVFNIAVLASDKAVKIFQVSLREALNLKPLSEKFGEGFLHFIKSAVLLKAALLIEIAQGLFNLCTGKKAKGSTRKKQINRMNGWQHFPHSAKPKMKRLIEEYFVLHCVELSLGGRGFNTFQTPFSRLSRNI